MESQMNIDHFRLIREKEVLKLTGLSRSTLHRMVDAGEFPPPVRTSRRSVAWRLREVLAWLESRPLARISSLQPLSSSEAECDRRSGAEHQGPGLPPSQRR